MSPLLRARVAGQAGLVTRAQLLGAGWTYEMIRWRVSSGRWVRVHPGVYLTTPGRDDWELRAVAALLAVGSPSCLFGQSAGEAWGLVPRTEPASDESLDDVSVVVPFDRGAATVDGITVSRSRHFAARVHPTEWPHRPTVEHTVLDLALGHGVDRCIALMAKACQLRLTNESALAKALEDRPTQPYRRLLREALGLVAGGAESAAEVRYIRDVEQAHGLPSGVRQEPAPGSRSRDSEYPGSASSSRSTGGWAMSDGSTSSEPDGGTAKRRPPAGSRCAAVGPMSPPRPVSSRPTSARSSPRAAGGAVARRAGQRTATCWDRRPDDATTGQACAWLVGSSPHEGHTSLAPPGAGAAEGRQ